jgi:predicted O-methyltransferase YrrM
MVQRPALQLSVEAVGVLTALPHRESQNTSYSLNKERVTREGTLGQTLKYIRNSWEKPMTTLAEPTLSILIDRLFAEADAAENARRHEAESLSPEQRATDRADYRRFYGRLKDQPLPVSRTTGKLLYLLARSIRAQNIVEFGTSFGISTLHLAAALRDNGGGHLIGSEFEPSKIVRARQNLVAGGLFDLVEIREGDALETLARDLPDSIDFVLLDGAKNLYLSIISLLEGRLRAGALVVADNADASPEYLARVRSTAHGYLSVPSADDVELSMRLGTGVFRNGAAPHV